ncbi:MAG: molybdopterin-dependent oxidoreductase [Desulfobacterales bacterium]|nr:molybdopterin-dependent oxidoreductase [Desulfobacterales bacterium]
MKVDRRSFLGLGLGAVAGAAVSPAGMKLTDDSSIMTQNWFGLLPVPIDGEITFDNSVCSLCKGSCGITVKKVAGRAIKIEGQDDHPINKGGICLHGIAGLQYLYDPSRIKSPLQKIGDRFEKISWDDAVSHIAEKLTAIKDQQKPESIACISGNDEGSVSELFKRFLKVFGSNNFYSMASMDTTWETTASKMHGKSNTLSFDIENSSFILSFGSGFIEGWGSPVHCFKTNAARKKKNVNLYQIEPRLSNTAAGADKWIPIKPGTEADLALGLCNIIINEEIYDITSISKSNSSFQAFSKMVAKDYTPEKVAETTGIDLALIKQIAHKFAWADKPIAIAGKGRGDTAGDTKEFAAVHALNCLAGNINKKGGTWVSRKNNYLKFPLAKMDSIAKNGFSKPRYTSFETLIDKVAQSSDSDIQALFVLNSNPCYTMRDSDKVIKAFENIPFKVSFSSFMDETAKKADIILPTHMFLERYEDIPSPSAGITKKTVGLSRPLVKPIFDTNNAGDAILMIAKALKGNVAENFPWSNYKKCLESVTKDIWSSLSDKGFVVLTDKPSYLKPSTDFFHVTNNLKSVEAQGDKKSFPLTLISIDNVRIAGGEIASSPFAIKTVSDKVIKGTDILVELNPETAAKARLAHGDKAKITTPVGSALVKVNVFEGIMPGLIGMAQGLGRTLDNKYVADKGVNINKLIAPVIEPGSGQDAAWGIAASISKV